MFLKENTTESNKKSKKSKKMEKPEKCPLCCENLEPDDLNFLPCPCGYKVCLFCWNRIRTSENDPKCPLCRRTYSENPAKFEPLSAEQLQKLKNKKKLEDVKKKQKLAEDRKQLADVRVVRKNLIFVNDLPLGFSKDTKPYQRFYNIFKQAGPVKKITILNSSKNYAGQKAPFARAYVTYQKNEDALKALKMFENLEFEDRILKLSLGTTKYCSNFIKNVNCTNRECVYLHEQADTEASFTKEQIHAGKHIEYGAKLYEQYVNSQLTKSISNAITEEKKIETQQQHTEELEKEHIIENNISPSTSQQNNQSSIINDRIPSPTEEDSLRAFKHLNDIGKVNQLSEPSPTNNYNSRENCLLHQLRTTVYSNQSNNSTPELGSISQSAKQDIPDQTFEDRFITRDSSMLPNGDTFHDDRFPSTKKESLLSRLNIIGNHCENNSSFKDNFRNPFPKEVVSHNNFVSEELHDSIDLKLEGRDDCNLDFDPVNFALGGLGELMISEKQKARVEVNSINATPIGAFKKQQITFPAQQQQSSSNVSSFNKSTSNQPPVQPKIPQQQPQTIFSPNSFIHNNITTVYPQQSRSQNSPVVDYFGQQQAAASFRPSSVQQQTPQRSSTSSQRTPFANALSVQLPRYSPGMSMGTNSMVNGYSPQPYVSQISPQDAYLLSHQQQQQQQQQTQSFENFPQQFSNFDQISSSQVFGVNALQNQSMRDSFSIGSNNLSFGQRIRNEALGRQQSYQQQQLQLQQQRLNTFCNSTPQSDSLNRPKGSSTFLP